MIPKYFQGCAAGGYFLAGAAQYISAYFFVGLFILIQVAILETFATKVCQMVVFNSKLPKDCD